MFLFRVVLNILVRNASPRGPMCFRCLIFNLSGPCELLFLFCFIASWTREVVSVMLYHCMLCVAVLMCLFHTCDPRAYFFIYLASSTVTPAGSLHISRVDNVCVYGCR